MLAQYRELTAKIDAFVARVEARHAADMRCGAGCDGCCHQRLTITGVEAAALAAWAAERSVAERRTIAAAARSEDRTRCAALDDAGRCRVYAARPLVCRSHGVPVRLPSRLDDARSLPVVTSCALNFTARGPAAADADCVLDQTLVSTMLGLVEQAHAAATGRTAGTRLDLADVLAALDAATAAEPAP